MKCDFQQIDDGRLQCVNCGAIIKTHYSPERVHRQCIAKTDDIGPRPGTQLKLLLSSYGVPICQACSSLARQMDEWGPQGCRERLDEIVDEILPRAREWVRQSKPWVDALLPGAVKDIALRRRIRKLVEQAIEAAESKSP